MMNYNIRIGGEAGYGIATVANVLAKLFLELGYYVFSSKEYSSRIKGGHNFHNLRISDKEINADIEKIDILIAFDNFSIEKHQKCLKENGLIISDKEFNPNVALPIKEITTKMGEKKPINGILIGATAKIFGIDLSLLNEIFEDYFAKKQKLKEILVKAAEEGYNSTQTKIKTEKLASNKSKLISGNQAIVKGALKAKLEFHVQYPMTPVSAILHSLAKEASKNDQLTVIQPEDEIAAINMALGASYTGARSMTATSGGGFALMVESMGLSSMAEIPLVVIEGQRPGPATGLPTKQEQGDLKFMLSSGTGDFPHVVIAPATIEECYTETKRAFYLAEKYHLPVIVLVDKYLTESFKTVDLEKVETEFTFDYDKKINIQETFTEKDLNPDQMFKRYSSDNRSVPGSEGIYTCSADEHNQVGLIIEDSETRKKMMERRMKKLEDIKIELPKPVLIGPKDAELTIISWGSNKGAIIELIETLNEKDKKVNCLILKNMRPFQNNEIKEILENSKQLVLIENNYSAQLGDLIAEKTGIMIKNKILRYDGKPYVVNDLEGELQKWLN
jgi:2-oxoglutarate/2-oxoacid ferredoxin oxidoreductase subunit alpha